MSDNPPFDGKPCPACPIEVRGLHAAAHNACLAVEAAANGRGEWERAFRQMAKLREAVDGFQPAVNEHFKDRRHSHGERHEARDKQTPT